MYRLLIFQVICGNIGEKNTSGLSVCYWFLLLPIDYCLPVCRRLHIRYHGISWEYYTTVVLQRATKTLMEQRCKFLHFRLARRKQILKLANILILTHPIIIQDSIFLKWKLKATDGYKRHIFIYTEYT